MRPVNLIPPEERRGEGAPSRTGALSWVVVGVLAIALVAVTGVVLAKKDVNDKETEVAALEEREAEVSARADELAAFSSFAQVKQQRIADLTSLANSRFDWQRVIRELSLVIPDGVWLVNLTGKVSPEVSVEAEAGIGLRNEVAGPALELVGCARGQTGVARLIAAMEDIDGVTRVTASRSEKPTSEVTDSSGDPEEVREDCRTRDFITQFELVAAFDAVEVAAAPGEPAPPAAPAPEAGSEATPASDGDDVEQAQQARAEEGRGVDRAEGDAKQAANIVPGGGDR